jgi:hypothetical protein
MRITGFVLLAMGAAVMLGAFLYQPYIRYDEGQILSQQIHAQNKALNDRISGISTPMLDEESFPSAVYSPEKAQTRGLAFGGGAALLLLGGIFVAAGSRRANEGDLHPRSDGTA